jgi:phospholipid transport system substrate-binding protein
LSVTFGFAKEVSKMTTTCKKACHILVAAGVMLWVGSAAAPSRVSAMNAVGMDPVRNLYDTLLANMRSGPALGAHGRYIRIEPVVRRVFDMQSMTRLAVGPDWDRLNDNERRQVSDAFERYICAIYADRFDSYSGERLQVTGEQTDAIGTMVTTEIVNSQGEPVHLNYLLRQNAGAWQIVDVYLNGTISELATRRSEFHSILRAQGIAGLIVMLNTKADLLIARAS